MIVFAPGNRTSLFRIGGGRRCHPRHARCIDLEARVPIAFLISFPTAGVFCISPGATHRGVTGIYVGSLDSAATRVLNVDSIAAYAPPGYLLFARDRALLARPFDASPLRMAGEPVHVVDDVHFTGPSSYARFSVSDRVLAYRTSAAVAPPSTGLVYARREGD